MKKIIITFSLVFVFASLFSQKIKYSISAGTNYSYFAKFNQHSFIDPEATSFAPHSGYSSVSYYGGYNNSHFVNGDIVDRAGFGFFVDNNFAFKINKRISFKTGFGLKMNNVYLHTYASSNMIYFSGTNSQTFYNDHQPFIIPGAVVVSGDSTYIINNSVYLYPYYSPAQQLRQLRKTNFKILSITIPIQIQVNLLKERLLISTGFSISRIINVSETGHSADSNFEKVFYSLNAGADYRVFRNFFVGISYDMSISQLKKQTYSYYSLNSQNKLHMNDFSLRLTYQFK